MGESRNSHATLQFDRRVRLEFYGATITSTLGFWQLASWTKPWDSQR